MKGQPTSAHPSEPYREVELVELISLEPSLVLDIRYARSDNFVGYPVYPEARAFLQRPAAEALVRVHQALKPRGYGLVVFDGYRPWDVTKLFWDVTSGVQRQFVANPVTGSRHNRGCAVDLSLVELTTVRPVDMPSDFDEMTERSHCHYPGGTKQQRIHRTLLQQAMMQEGFTLFDPEWWHFDYQDWPLYPVLNLQFPELS